MSHDDDAAPSWSSFDRFLETMAPKMKRLLAAHRIPPEDAEDVLQQALVALIYHWDTIRDPECWLFVTLRRHCSLYWRNQRRRLYSAVDATILECLSRPVAPPQERGDLVRDLRQMIDRLPARCRSVLELRFLLGYEAQEVARRLGYRDSSMTQVTNRCLAALAREMLSAGHRVLPAAPAAAPSPAAVGWRQELRPAPIASAGPRRPRRAEPVLPLPRQ